MSRISKVCLVVDHLEDGPAKVTQLIGFQPSAVVSCGFSSLPARDSWVYEFGNPQATRLEDDLEAMAHFLKSRAEDIRKVAAHYPTYVQIYINDIDWKSPYEPNGYRSGGFELSPEIVALVSRLGLGFKTYFFCGIREETKET